MLKRPLKSVLFTITTGAFFFYCGKTSPTDSLSAPAVTTQPESQVVLLGAAASFSVSVSGNPEPAFQWYKAGGAPLPGETGAQLTVPAVAFADSGSYAVVVSNSEGTVTSDSALLIVYTLTVQPPADTVSVDSAFSFTATVSGIATPTCQWRLNGFDIPGATGLTYGKTSAAVDDAGAYRLVVSCAFKDVFSDPVLLTVNP